MSNFKYTAYIQYISYGSVIAHVEDFQASVGMPI